MANAKNAVRKLQDFSKAEKEFMLKIARESIEDGVMHIKKEMPKRVPSRLLENGACFVTLTHEGHLRGCIGSLEAHEPLIKNIIRNAYNAAFRDPRFMPVQKDEIEDIDIEISVLTKPKELKYSDERDLLNKLNPPYDGVILSKSGRSATFLPTVWEHFKIDGIYDKIGFLTELCLKAGLDIDEWKKGCKIEIYHTIVIREK